MNILPKKSWHVRSRQNIERVKRDEAQAAEEKKRTDERAALAEQEARTALLRRKAQQLPAAPDQQQNLSGEPVPGQLTSDTNKDEHLALQTTSDRDTTFSHVDLFSHLSAEKPKGQKNEDHEKEEKAAKEKYERSIGLLTYLGQSSAEAQTSKPWYFKTPDRKDPEEQSCPDLKRKTVLDPMMAMEKYLGVKRSKADILTKSSKDKALTKVPSHSDVPVDRKPVPRDPAGEAEASPDDRRRTRHKHKSKHKKHKQKHQREEEKGRRSEGKTGHRHREKSSASRTGGGEEKAGHHQGPSIQQLREERLRREAVERAKANRLLSGEKLEGTGEGSKEVTDLPGRYNSQFHPELARSRRKAFNYNVS